jgi:hypothetical protein
MQQIPTKQLKEKKNTFLENKQKFFNLYLGVLFAQILQVSLGTLAQDL